MLTGRQALGRDPFSSLRARKGEVSPRSEAVFQKIRRRAPIAPYIQKMRTSTYRTRYARTESGRKREKAGRPEKETKIDRRADKKSYERWLLDNYGTVDVKLILEDPVQDVDLEEDEILFNLGYDVSIAVERVMDPKMEGALKKYVHTGSGSYKAVEHMKDGLSRDAGLSSRSDYQERIVKDSVKKSIKIMEKKGYSREANGEWTVKPTRWGINKDVYQTKDIQGEYNDILRSTIARETQLLEGGLTMMRIQAMIVREVEAYENKSKDISGGWRIPPTKRDVEKGEVMHDVAQVMAHYIEDGMKERLESAGLGDSDLYHSIVVWPMVGFKNPHASDTGKVAAAVGVTIKMKVYGFWVDKGRGPSNTQYSYESYWDSPFYRALYAWAKDNLRVHGMGKYTFNKKSTGTRVRDIPDDELPPVREVEHYRDWESEGLGFGKKGWIREARSEERRIGGPGKYYEGVSGSTSEGRTGLRREGRTKTTMDTNFEGMVYAIWKDINKKGFTGNQFLSKTLIELSQKGILEYYMTYYLSDYLVEQERYRGPVGENRYTKRDRTYLVEVRERR